MSIREQFPADSALSDYTTAADVLGRTGQVFPTQSSLEWFVKQHRAELIEKGALLPRKGRAGSLFSISRFPQLAVEILRREALDSVSA